MHTPSECAVLTTVSVEIFPTSTISEVCFVRALNNPSTRTEDLVVRILSIIPRTSNLTVSYETTSNPHFVCIFDI